MSRSTSDTHLQVNLAAKVDDLVEKYRRITTTPAALAHFNRKPEYAELFSKVFQHYVRMLKSRPAQDVEKGYLTVYDRALMRLTGGGRDLNIKGGIALFIKEILGVEMGEEGDGVEAQELVIKANVAVQTVLMDGLPYLHFAGRKLGEKTY
jgi:hypothetical protein